MTGPAFTASRYEIGLIVEIARRAKAVLPGLPSNISTWVMDVEACHCNGTPLRLHDLLAASEGDFAHDLGMIFSEIDRKTGKLVGCGVPRYAVEQAAA